MNAKPLSQTWEWVGWLPLFFLTGLIAIPPGFIFGPYFSQTSGPLASVPSLTWYKTFLWTLDILTPLVTLALLWAFERVRGPLPLATKAYAGFCVDLLAVLRHVEIRLCGDHGRLRPVDGGDCHCPQAWSKVGAVGYDVAWPRHVAYRPAAHCSRAKTGLCLRAVGIERGNSDE